METRINKVVDEKENNVKLKVVVADDMEVIAKNMQSIIAGNSKVEKVWTAFDGEEEIIQIMKLEPDIVFTDNQMPKNNRKHTRKRNSNTFKKYGSTHTI